MYDYKIISAYSSSHPYDLDDCMSARINEYADAGWRCVNITSTEIENGLDTIITLKALLEREI